MFLKKLGLNQQKGGSLLIALFIMVIVSLLGTALLNTITSSGKTIAYQVTGTRALAAANTGAERRLNELFPLGNSLTAQRCDETTTYDDTGGTTTGLSQCSIATQCTDFKQFDVVYYHIESTGTCNLASRTIVVKAKFDEGVH